MANASASALAASLTVCWIRNKSLTGSLYLKLHLIKVQSLVSSLEVGVAGADLVVCITIAFSLWPAAELAKLPHNNSRGRHKLQLASDTSRSSARVATRSRRGQFELPNAPLYLLPAPFTRPVALNMHKSLANRRVTPIKSNWCNQ
ncbi:hypothetical protein ACLKA7_007488 [Drosophila subpalustris]